MFKIPKEYSDFSTYGFDQLIPVQLNDVRVETLVIRVMERAIRGNRTSKSTTKPENLEEYLRSLSVVDGLEGFDSDVGREVLEGWLLSSILVMGTKGLQRTGSQMDYLRPLTVASYRSGLPKQELYFRKADSLIYSAISTEIHERSKSLQAVNIADTIKKLFMGPLGIGVDLGDQPHLSPQVDQSNSTAEIDINSLLQLRFVNVFPPLSEKSKNDITNAPNSISSISPIGWDLVSLLQIFGKGEDRWSVSEIVSSMTCLMSLRLFQMPLLIGELCEHALSKEEFDPKSVTTSSLELFCDITGDTTSQSHQLSRRCVARDLEKMSKFFDDFVRLRTIASLSKLDTKHSVVLDWETPNMLKGLADLTNEPGIQLAAGLQYNMIKNSVLSDKKWNSDETQEFFEALDTQEISHLDRLIRTQTEALNKQVMMGITKWFWSTGGLKSGGAKGMETHSLLRGNKHRPFWAYAPSDEFLKTMITMVFIDNDGSRAQSRLSMSELLQRLKDRYGLLFGEPPAEFDSPENRSAAKENMEALLKKLHQLGCYSGLTDDLNAQYVTRPRS